MEETCQRGRSDVRGSEVLEAEKELAVERCEVWRGRGKRVKRVSEDCQRVVATVPITGDGV